MAIEAKEIKAAAITADLTTPTDARAVVVKARGALGPITALHWNAYATAAGNLLEANAGVVRGALDVAVTSLLAVIREASDAMCASAKSGARNSCRQGACPDSHVQVLIALRS